MITIQPNEGGYETGFVIDGHAGYAEKGYDIVCASVTASMYTSYFNLVRAVGKANVKLDLKSGRSQIFIVTTTPSSDKIVGSFIDFCKQVQRDYPQHITIEGAK